VIRRARSSRFETNHRQAAPRSRRRSRHDIPSGSTITSPSHFVRDDHSSRTGLFTILSIAILGIARSPTSRCYVSATFKVFSTISASASSLLFPVGAERRLSYSGDAGWRRGVHAQTKCGGTTARRRGTSKSKSDQGEKTAVNIEITLSPPQRTALAEVESLLARCALPKQGVSEYSDSFLVARSGVELVGDDRPSAVHSRCFAAIALDHERFPWSRHCASAE